MKSLEKIAKEHASAGGMVQATNGNSDLFAEVFCSTGDDDHRTIVEETNSLTAFFAEFLDDYL